MSIYSPMHCDSVQRTLKKQGIEISIAQALEILQNTHFDSETDVATWVMIEVKTSDYVLMTGIVTDEPGGCHVISEENQGLKIPTPRVFPVGTMLEFVIVRGKRFTLCQEETDRCVLLMGPLFRNMP
jgi:hypothetical protein